MLRYLQLFLMLVGLLFAGPASLLYAQERGYLGVDLQDVSSERAVETGLTVNRGAFVVNPRRDSPAERSGLRAGDVILEIDGIEIENMAGVVRYVGQRPPGTNVKIVIWRSRQTLELEATVGPFPLTLSLIQQIDTLLGQQKYAEAVSSAERLVAITRDTPGLNSPEHLAALERLAPILENVARAEDAEAIYRQVVEGRESTLGAEHLQTAMALTQLAGFYVRRGRYSDADPLYRRVLAIYEKQLGPDHPWVAWTLKAIGDTLYSLNKPLEAEPLLRRSLAIREKTASATDPDLGWAHHSLGNTLDQLSRYDEAIAHYRSAIATLQAARGPEHDDVGLELGNLGATLRKAGRYDEAMEALYRALVIRKKTFGEEHTNIAWILNEIGKVLAAERKFREAIPYLQRALAIREKAFGADDVSLAIVLTDLAGAAYALAELEEAENFYRRALGIREKRLGADDPDVGWAHNRLGITLDALNRFDEAIEHLSAAIRIMQVARGPEHDDVGVVLGTLGGTLSRAARYREAEEILRRALAIRERTLGPDHADLGWLLETIAHTIRFQSRLSEAELFALRSLANRERALGPNSWEVARSLKALADVYERQNRYVEAVEHYERALRIMERISGTEHPDAGYMLISLAFAYRGQGRFAEGEVLVRRALAIFEQSLGAEHLDVADALESLAYQVEDQNRYPEAEPLYRRSMAIREKRLGPQSYRVAVSLGDLANNLYQQSRYVEAESLERRALAIREQQFGLEHPELAQSYGSLADILRYTGRAREAEGFARRALALREKGLGAAHPRVAVDLNTLALVLDALRRPQEAEPLYKRALEIREKALGADHPAVAWNHNRLGLLAENAKHWEDALAHYRIAAKIVSQRALNTMSRWRTEDDEARRTSYVFRNLIDAAWELSVERIELDEQLMREAFIAAQWRERSEASAAMAQMTARFGAADATLAELVREGQDLRARWSMLERRQLQTASLTGERRDEALITKVRQEFDATSHRLDEITSEIARRDPAYADLSNPQPLAIDAVQKLLREDEVLIVFAHTGSDTYYWAVTAESADWGSLGLGGKYLSEAVEKLRCGLDQAAWYGDGRKKCVDLLGSSAVTMTQTGVIDLPLDLGAAHELYDDLFSDFDHLLANKHILIVPSGPLTQLPFHVLVTEQPDASATPDKYKSVGWLGVRHPISIIPSVSSLSARKHAKTSKAKRPFIGFANPLLEGPDKTYELDAKAARAAESCPAAKGPAAIQRVSSAIPDFDLLFRGASADLKQVRALVPLPDTTDEVCGVAQSVNASAADLWIGSRATERNVKRLSETDELAKYRIVHFATHGLIAGGYGELQASLAEPAIVLTPPPDGTSVDDLAVDDGLLTASEIAALRMDADWVILSACNSAAGGAKGAEALSGLARAFFYAGARALLVSHWDVYSSAAVELVTGAVEELKNDPTVGRAEALRRSMSAIINQGGFRAHPAYWAPFVIVGEGAALQ
jgi:tetratricopeptide (TPR) repeat protein/CHAT domain-containing protein